ncbi:MAG: hypothetical protein ACRDD8_05295 [Bacteroidales bacterium]
MEMRVHFISNPFLNTTREHEGWSLVNKVIDITGWEDNIPFHSYREMRIPNTNIEIGEVIYVKSNKSFIGKVLSYYYTDEFELSESSGVLLVSILELRTKKIYNVPVGKIMKPIEVNKMEDLMGIGNYQGTSKIMEYVNNSIITRDINGTLKGYRLYTMGGIYECFEGLRAKGFPIYYRNEKTELITNFSDLKNFCNTLNCKLLLNNTEDSMRWQISDANDIKFDFEQFINEKGYEFYLL